MKETGAADAVREVEGDGAAVGAGARLQAAFRRVLPGRRLSVQELPLVPEIRLWLVDPASMQGPLTHEEAQAVVACPAYWSFCWASGQVLARWLLDHPQQVRGKRVVDVGSGSGVVAIAACLAGAAEVVACDLDPEAALAVIANAALNGVSPRVSRDWQESATDALITAADILYDRDNLALLQAFRQCADRVLLADSRVPNLQQPGYVAFHRSEATTWPDLEESAQFRQVALYEAC